MKIAIIGAGNMGCAIAGGFIASHKVVASDIVVSNPSTGKLNALAGKYPGIRTTTNNISAACDANIVILAVKPWKVESVVTEIRPHLNLNNVIIASVAAGVSTAQLGAMLQTDTMQQLPPLYYIIPNTAASVGQSMTFISGAHTMAQSDNYICALFEGLGRVMMVEERLIGACMALSSCGLAYAMRYVRASVEGAVELGLPPTQAQDIVLQTLQGAVALLGRDNAHPEAEIDKITTPGGLTIRGLNAMEQAGFTSAVIAGLRASVKN
ncbi:MAG: pyrroline-5-carboxylate reductase [Muribaculaceae bacterium]|nr:pyrroline-5-carboxylate reductase [Muribaculaceae bacterium]